MFSPSKLSESPRMKLMEHVDPVGPRAGLHDQRDSKDDKLPSCGHKIYEHTYLELLIAILVF